ncbi:MAG: N-acetyl-gamma-glutamyl-phosphate reductase, partial [Acidimicrobiales bacterium]
MRRVGIVGASGYAGAELLRLCLAHPGLEVAWATAGTSAGARVASLYPNLTAAAGDLAFVGYEPTLADDVDLVFL